MFPERASAAVGAVGGRSVDSAGCEPKEAQGKLRPRPRQLGHQPRSNSRAPLIFSAAERAVQARREATGRLAFVPSAAGHVRAGRSRCKTKDPEVALPEGCGRKKSPPRFAAPISMEKGLPHGSAVLAIRKHDQTRARNGAPLSPRDPFSPDVTALASTCCSREGPVSQKVRQIETAR